ncbi:hypothetical protein M231_06483 [Tremella mesenterica]|uniref:Uncharacterized protein n=1 Tax=Tremella mesenterica TaxID=5217 RepID=A0A4Q1BBX1_TREME|nr:hypothetical protein M231_06483 [Tremella mesenterica]
MNNQRGGRHSQYSTRQLYDHVTGNFETVTTTNHRLNSFRPLERSLPPTTSRSRNHTYSNQSRNSRRPNKLDEDSLKKLDEDSHFLSVDSQPMIVYNSDDGSNVVAVSSQPRHEADLYYQSERQIVLDPSIKEWLGGVQSVPTWTDPNNPEEDEETLTRIEEEDSEDSPAASSEEAPSSTVFQDHSVLCQDSADDVEAFDEVKVEKTIPMISADTYDRSLKPCHDSYHEAKIASSSTVQWTPSDRRIRQLQVGVQGGPRRMN